MYIFDANVFLNYFRKSENTLEKVENFIQMLLNGSIKVLTPDLCFYEVIYNLKKKEVINKKIINLLDEFLQLDNLIIYKLDAKEYKNILSISIEHNISTYDWVYVYLHNLFSKQKIITLDKRLFNSINDSKNIIYIGK
jgi:predicted nucleic acid-binding protein